LVRLLTCDLDSWTPSTWASGASCCSACFTLMASATASTMGSIMAVVAVLDIHMERNMVVNMKPSMSLAWLVPTIMMILRATLLWRPQCSTAMAMIRPPRNM